MAELAAQPPIKSRSALRIPHSAFRLRGVWLGGLAGLVCLWALAAWPGEAGHTAANWGLVAAGVLAVIAWWDWRSTDAAPADRPWWIERRLLPALIGVAALTILGNLAYLVLPPAIFGLPGLLWLASLALLVIATGRSAVSDQRSEIRDQNPQRTTRITHHVSRITHHAARWEWLALGGLLALALVARLWDLQNVPFAVHPDETEMGDVALAAYRAGPPPPIFSTIWQTIELPAVWFVAVAGSLGLGGDTLAALRLPAALAGALTVLPVYGLLREGWGRRAALTGGVIFATSAANVHFSRVAVNNIVTPLFWAACAYFLLRAVRRGQPRDWALAGIMGGLGEYTFYGTRLLPFILIAFALYLLVTQWRRARALLAGLGVLALGYLAAFGPLLAHMLTQPNIYFSRGANKMTWDHLPLSWADAQAAWRTLWPLVAENLQGFVFRPSLDGFYWSPLLLPGEAALLVLGVALLIRQWRRPAAFLTLLAGAGVLFVGGTLVRGAPYPIHWTPAFPFYYAALAVPLGAWLAGWGRLGGGGRMVGGGLVALGLLVNAGLNIQFYQQEYVQARPEFQARSILARWAAALGPAYRVYSVGRSWLPYDQAYTKYLAPGQEGGVLWNPARDLPGLNGLPPGRGLAFLFAYDNAQYLPIVQLYYPQGTLEQIKSGDGTLLFAAYRLTPAQASSGVNWAGTSGLRVTYDVGQGPVTAADPFIGFTALGWPGGGNPPGNGPPTRARWAGQLLVQQGGTYGLELHADGAAQLYIDGQPVGYCVSGSQMVGTLNLAAGPHDLRLDYAGRATNRKLELYWTPPGGVRALIPPSAMLHGNGPAPALPDRLPCGDL